MGSGPAGGAVDSGAAAAAGGPVENGTAVGAGESTARGTAVQAVDVEMGGYCKAVEAARKLSRGRGSPKVQLEASRAMYAVQGAQSSPQQPQGWCWRGLGGAVEPLRPP